MALDDDLHRLRQAWKYAEGDARRDFLYEILQQQGLRGESEITMTSQVNSRDGSPAVLFRWGDHILHMNSETAKRHALSILETAMGADADAFVFAFAVNRIGIEPEKAAQLLMDFRAWREAEERRRATEGES